MLTDRLIDQVRAARPEVEIETIEVLAHPVRAIRDKVLMVPTIVIGNRRWHHAPALAELLEALDSLSTSNENRSRA